LFREALTIFREIGDASGAGLSLSHLGDVAREKGRYAQAARLYRESADTFRKAGDRWGLARTYVDLAGVACDQNETESAHWLLKEALDIFLDLHHTRGIARTLEGFAHAAVRRRRFEEALALGGAAEALRVRVGAPARPLERTRVERKLEPAWRAVAAGAAERLWSEGGKAPLEEVIRRACEGA
jgi:hypothetical protein